MAMLIGQCLVDPPTGACGRVFTLLQAAGDPAFSPDAFTMGSPGRKSIATLVEALVGGIIAEIVNDGEVAITITPLDAGLQRDADGAHPHTLAPVAPVTLAQPGTIA